MIQVCTITNLVIPFQTGGTLFHSAPSWPARNYRHRAIYNREMTIEIYLFTLDDLITLGLDYLTLMIIWHSNFNFFFYRCWNLPSSTCHTHQILSDFGPTCHAIPATRHPTIPNCHPRAQTRSSFFSGCPPRLSSSSFTTWKEQRLSIWLRKRWKSSLGDFTPSTWCGFNVTKSQKLLTTNTNKWEIIYFVECSNLWSYMVLQAGSD